MGGASATRLTCDTPASLAEVTEREKDIRFSCRTRLNTTNQLERQAVALGAQRLLQKLPAALRKDPDALALARVPGPHGVDVVHLIYLSKHYESQSKDYEFSQVSVQEHWVAGLADMIQTLRDPRWVNRPARVHGVHVFDLASNKATAMECTP